METKKKGPKHVLVVVPTGMLEQIDFVAEVEHRNRSNLIREALRRYIEAHKKSQQPPDIAIKTEYVVETAEQRVRRMLDEEKAMREKVLV